jgi:hypothetical protein
VGPESDSGFSTIAENCAKCGVDAAVLHREYSNARKEYHAALLHVVRFHHPDSDAEVELEAQALLVLLS